MDVGVNTDLKMQKKDVRMCQQGDEVQQFQLTFLGIQHKQPSKETVEKYEENAEQD